MSQVNDTGAHGTWGDPEPDAPAVTYWFKTHRTNGSVDFIPYLIDDDTGVGVGVSVADLNGDGYQDVMVGNKKGMTVLIHQVQEVDEETWAAAQPKPYSE